MKTINQETRQDPEDVWFGATGEVDGKPLFCRGRKQVPAGVNESDYPTLMNIDWPYKSEGDSGLPDTETEQAQTGLEHALDELDAVGVGFLMLVLTGSGRTTWHWYVADRNTWIRRLNKVLAGHPTYPIQIEGCVEPDWSLYHDYMSRLNGI